MAQKTTAMRAADWIKIELLEDVPLVYTVKEMLEQGTVAQMLLPKHLVKQGDEATQKLTQGQNKFKQLAEVTFVLKVEGDTDLPSKYAFECYFMDGLAAGRHPQQGVPSSTCTLSVAVNDASCAVDVSTQYFGIQCQQLRRGLNSTSW
eukprot:3443133-Amphidinium_carterae.1